MTTEEKHEMTEAIFALQEAIQSLRATDAELDRSMLRSMDKLWDAIDTNKRNINGLSQTMGELQSREKRVSSHLGALEAWIVSLDEWIMTSPLEKLNRRVRGTILKHMKAMTDRHYIK
jgi:chromosome segregation ATPase